LSNFSGKSHTLIRLQFPDFDNLSAYILPISPIPIKPITASFNSGIDIDEMAQGERGENRNVSESVCSAVPFGGLKVSNRESEREREREREVIVSFLGERFE